MDDNTYNATEALAALAGRRVVLKYGGNAMRDPSRQRDVLRELAQLSRAGARCVLVHGGGPAIAALLERVGVESRFEGGQRITTPEAMGFVEMALSGQVNRELVAGLQREGVRAVGISGKDGGLALARPLVREGADGRPVDLGQVGEVAEVDPGLLELLMGHGYLPVVAPIASGPEGGDFNINADLFAGALAAALGCDHYVVLTDVAGLRRDPDDPASTVARIGAPEAGAMVGGAVRGGMIPKVQGCLAALGGGVGAATIVDGTVPGQWLAALRGEAVGTTIQPGGGPA